VGASRRNSSRIRDTVRRNGIYIASMSFAPVEISEENSASTSKFMSASRASELA